MVYDVRMFAFKLFDYHGRKFIKLYKKSNFVTFFMQCLNSVFENVCGSVGKEKYIELLV